MKAVRRYLGNHLLFEVPGGGFYLWCRLQVPVSTSKLLHEATKYGVFLVPGEAFYIMDSEDNEFRLCFATYPEPVLTEGVKRLTKAFVLAKQNKTESFLSTRFNQSFNLNTGYHHRTTAPCFM